MKSSKAVKGTTSTNKISSNCLACGIPVIKPRRRYCSAECRNKMIWVLSLSKGLLRVFNSRYAAFSFTDHYVVLDILPFWTNSISRFVYKRTSGEKPSDDLKKLIIQSGREWYAILDNNKSKSYASLCLLQKTHNKDLDPESIKPNRKRRPKLSRRETEFLKLLQLKREDLHSRSYVMKIKTAYKKMAKIHHPDIGGSEEKFKMLNEAHQQMLLWAEKPQFISRIALHDSWSYNGNTDRWAPPL